MSNRSLTIVEKILFSIIISMLLFSIFREDKNKEFKKRCIESGGQWYHVNILSETHVRLECVYNKKPKPIN